MADLPIPLRWEYDPSCYRGIWRLFCGSMLLGYVFINGDGMEVRARVIVGWSNGNGVMAEADPGPEVRRQRQEVEARVCAGACPSLVDYLLVWSDGPPEGGNARQRRRWRRAVRRTLDAWGLDA